MIYKATRLIKQEMDRQEFHYRIEEHDGKSVLIAGFGIDNGPSVQVLFISPDNDNDVSIRLFGIVNKVAENKTGSILKAINECNNKFRYLKFTLDKDGDVNIEYDLPIKADDRSVGAEACEIFSRIMHIADEAYPVFMKAMWN